MIEQVSSAIYAAPGIIAGQFEVPANLEVGVEFTNAFNVEVEVKFSPSGMWSHGPDTLYPATGMQNYPYQEQMTHLQSTSFALLAVDKQSNNVLAEVGTEQTIRLQPGQTLRFKMNDASGAYENNLGKIIINWSATEPSEVTPPLTICPPVSPVLEGQFQVPVTAPQGIDFSNTTGVAKSYTFRPSGNWKPAAWADCTAAGWKDFAYQWSMQYPNQNSFALLAVNKQTNTVVAELAVEMTIVLKPGETLTFLVNDLPSCYDDNIGNLIINWSAK